MRLSASIFPPLVALALLLAGCAERATAPTTAPAVAVRAERAALSVASGDRASVAVLLTRSGGFAGNVTVSVSGVPTGVDVTVDTQPRLGDRAVLGIAPGFSAVAGSYTLTVTAAGDGVPAATTTIAVEITTAQAYGVSLTYCPALAPLWVAFQDGDGAWTRVLPTTVNGNVVFQRGFQTQRGGVATVRSVLDDGTTLLEVTFAHPTELRALSETDRLACGDAIPHTLQGDVSGLAAGDIAIVGSGFFDRQVAGVSDTRFAIGVPPGPLDVLATRVAGSDAIPSATAMILRRDVDLPDGATMAPFGFAAGEAFAPARAAVTVANLGADYAFTGTGLHTANSEIPELFDNAAPIGATRDYFALPEDRLLPADLQVLYTDAYGASSAARSVELYFRPVVDRTVTLGAPAIAPAIDAVGTPLRPRARFVAQDDYDRSTSILYQQASGPAAVLVVMTATYAELGGAGYELTLPDFSFVDGFDPGWTLRQGRQIGWTATRVGGSIGFGHHPRLGDGLFRRTAYLGDSITLH